MSDRSDIVVCGECGMLTCDVWEDDNSIEERCSMCGYLNNSVDKSVYIKGEKRSAVKCMSTFLDWAKRNMLERPTEYEVARSKDDGVEYWIVLNYSNLEGDYFPSDLALSKKLIKESEKIFKYFFTSDYLLGALCITEKIEIGKEGIDLIEYIINQ